MKKRLLALAMGVVIVLGCTACGGGQDAPSTEQTEGENASNTAGDSGSSTVVIAMGSGFSTLDPGYIYEKYPPLVIMHVMKICLNSTTMTVRQNHVLQIPMSFLKMV